MRRFHASTQEQDSNPNSSSNSLFREINIPFFKRFQRLVEDLRQIKHLIASWDHIIIISYQIWRSTSPKSPTSMRRWRQGHGLLRTILHPSENISCSFFQIFHHDHLNAIMTPEGNHCIRIHWMEAPVSLWFKTKQKKTKRKKNAQN